MKKLIIAATLLIFTCCSIKKDPPKEDPVVFNGMQVNLLPDRPIERRFIPIPQEVQLYPCEVAFIRLTDKDVMYVFAFPLEKFYILQGSFKKQYGRGNQTAEFNHR